MRGTRGTIENLIASEETLAESIVWWIERLETNNVPVERISIIKDIMWGEKLKLFITRYAIGIGVKKLAKDFDELLNDALDEWDGGVMNNMLTVSALCVLFRTNKETVEKIENIINKQLNYCTEAYNAKKDPFYYWLIDYLLQAAKGGKCKEYTQDKMKVPFYIKLCKAVSDKNNIESALKTYVDDWYKTPPYKHFIDLFDKNYAKFWCFEAAALAALFNVSIDNLKESVCFPADLVEYYKKS